jgi:hypothetical protein
VCHNRESDEAGRDRGRRFSDRQSDPRWFAESGELNLLGRANPDKTSASTIISVQRDVVPLDDVDWSVRGVELIREI